MSAPTADRRLTLVRDGLADQRLEGLVSAERFAAVTPMQASAPISSIRKAPVPDAEQEDQLAFGERFDVLFEVDGFSFGQARRDGYVGYVDLADLAALGAAPSHQVGVARTYAFAEPSIKTRPAGLYSRGALVAVEAREGRFAKGEGTGWFIEAHLTPIGVPAAEDRRRGDLVFWKGHVAILLDADTILHANAHHMAVAVEPLAEAIARIDAAGSGPPTGYRRL